MACLLIVVGHAYAYRSFYAIRNMRSPSGSPTNAIFGFIKSLAKMRARVGPTHVAVVWDGGLDEERRRDLPDYKAQRPAQLSTASLCLAASVVSQGGGGGVKPMTSS